MAEKAKAKKSKALAKKTASVRPKKKEISVKDAYHETDAEDLQLAQEELPKRGVKSSRAVAEKKTASAPEKKIDTKSIQAEDSPSKIAQSTPEIIAPIQPRVVVNKPVATPNEIKAEKPRQESPRQENPRHEAKAHAPAPAANDGLRVRLSESLVKKLKEQAADEGISLEEFISELLAESVVLRAWEIVERKNAMKGPSGQGQGPAGGGRNNNYNNQNQGNKGNNQRGGGGGGSGSGGGNQGNKGHRGMSHVRYQSIMDDKATFLEYVRSQEKTRR